MVDRPVFFLVLNTGVAVKKRSVFSSGNIFHKMFLIFDFARDTGGWVTQPVSFGSGGVSASTLLYYFYWDVEI